VRIDLEFAPKLNWLHPKASQGGVSVDPKVSIITGTYNSAQYLNHYFQRLDAQTFRDFEVVMVDDGSQDETVAIIERKMALDARYRLIKKVPEGFPSRSRALGLKEARGQFVAFCDHDDFWAPQKLALQMYAFSKFDGMSILHTDRIVWKTPEPPPMYYQFKGDFHEIPITKQRPEDVIYGGLQIIFSSFIGPKDLVQKIGFHPDMKGVDDFYLFLRLAALGDIYRIDLPLTYYFAHQSNLSHLNNIFVTGFYKVYDVLKNDPVPQKMKNAVLAQACRTEAVSLFASNRHKAFTLLVKSISLYFIPSTLNRLMFLLVTWWIPLPLQTHLFRWVKKIKFMFPSFKDLFGS
jgi:glycosyltransferase involved in cell wall biosynthesis